MAKKSRLDANGVESRKNAEIKNKYSQETNIYNADNESARANEGKALGKGTGKSLGFAVRNLEAPKTQINYSSIDTSEDAGGEYDKNGAKGVEGAFQGDAGRNWCETINIYNKENQYGSESIDIDTTVTGQFFTK